MRADGQALPAGVAALVTRPMWVRFEGGESTGSTNDDLRALAVSGAPEGTIVVVARQTAGRGRMGRVWESPRGGVYLSVLLRPVGTAEDLSALPLAIGVGVATGLESLGVRVALKWPNDVLWGDAGADGRAGGKIAGILLESAVGAGGASWVVAGCGINVARPLPPLAAHAGAAYLEDVAGRTIGLAAAAAAVLDGIADAYARAVRLGPVPLLADYERRSALRGRAVTVRDDAGAVVASGVVVGIDGSGGLVLDDAGTTRVVRAGDVTLRPLADETSP